MDCGSGAALVAKALRTSVFMQPQSRHLLQAQELRFEHSKPQTRKRTLDPFVYKEVLLTSGMMTFVHSSGIKAGGAQREFTIEREREGENSWNLLFFSLLSTSAPCRHDLHFEKEHKKSSSSIVALD